MLAIGAAPVPFAFLVSVVGGRLVTDPAPCSEEVSKVATHVLKRASRQIGVGLQRTREARVLLMDNVQQCSRLFSDGPMVGTREYVRLLGS